jgi:hypothetical protein
MPRWNPARPGVQLGMITEIPILAETKCVHSALSFRGNQSFRDHVRTVAAGVAGVAGLVGVA